MKPPPPTTATCMLFPLPGQRDLLRKERYAPARRPGSPPSERTVDGGHSGQDLIHLTVGHVRVHRQADMPGRQLLRHRKRRAGVVRKYRLPVQRKIINLTGQVHLETLSQLRLEPCPVRAGWQEHD